MVEPILASLGNGLLQCTVAGMSLTRKSSASGKWYFVFASCCIVVQPDLTYQLLEHKSRVTICIHCGIVDALRFPPPEGLGDHLANTLKRFGITKERWSALVNQFDAEHKGCGCDKRHKWVNWIGGKLGLSEGQGPELQEAIEAEHLPQQRVCECALHGRCLPDLRTENAVILAAAKAQGLALCHGCADREPAA